MLRTEAITKIYNHRKTAVTGLRDATLDVPAGDFVAVVGPSGSGKSTLLLMLGGMLSPSSGKVLFETQSLYDLSPDERARLRRRNIGFVFQQFNLLPRINARRQVELPLFYAGTSRRKGREMAQEALDLVGLADRADHRPDELSGGQQQRVAIARALVNKPSILLADEPTGALDSQTGTEVLDLVDELHDQGLTVIMVTHDPLVAQRAERVITLSDGFIVSDQENGKKLAKWVIEAGHETI